MKQKIGFIINPISGIIRNKNIEEKAQKVFQNSPYDISFHYTKSANDGPEIALNLAKNRINIIVCVGGDGSINDMIQKTIDIKDVVYGVIPMGSGNGLARSLDIPLNITKSLELIKRGNTMKIDIGKVNDTYFVSNVGVGIDTSIAAEFGKNKKRGFMTYAKISMKLFWKYKAERWMVTSERESKMGKYVMLNVCNMPQFGNNFYTAPRAKPNDGKLHILRIKDFPRFLGFSLVTLFFIKKIYKFPYTRLKSAQNIVICKENNKKFEYQCDGDLKGDAESLIISMLPSKINFLVP